MGEKYNNTIKVDQSNLIINTSYEDHKFVNRIAEVLATPVGFKHEISKGDIVLLHHNVFRTWYDVRGKEKRSSSYIDKDRNSCNMDQIYAVFKEGGWKPLSEYVFVAPVINRNRS